MPRWDLVLVLNALLEAPFEPLKTAELKMVTWKTVFLLLLMAGKRRGDIHAIDVSRVYAKQDQSEMILYPVLNYLPKVADAAEGQFRLQPIKIPAITQTIGRSRQEPDRLLCPVRAVSYYKDRTKTMKPRPIRRGCLSLCSQR